MFVGFLDSAATPDTRYILVDTTDTDTPRSIPLRYPIPRFRTMVEAHYSKSSHCTFLARLGTSRCWQRSYAWNCHVNFDGRAVNETTAKLHNSSAPHGLQNVTPCPTLFVANLGPSCSEEELIQVFSSCPGFLKLKMQSTYGTLVAFVDFQAEFTPEQLDSRKRSLNLQD